jgi:hypothetical protein
MKRGVTVSNYGEVGGAGGAGWLDFVVDAVTATRISPLSLRRSPFFMENTGTEVLLTTSHYSGNKGPYVQAVSWKPVDEAMSGGLGDNGAVAYDSVYAGKCVNRDATVAMERTLYAPRDNVTNPSFVVCKTMLYPDDGQPHEHIAFGSAIDWDVPSDRGSNNTSGVLLMWPGWPVPVLPGHGHGRQLSPSPEHLNRFAVEMLVGWNLSSASDPCNLTKQATAHWRERA